MKNFFVLLATVSTAFSQSYEIAWDHSPSFYSNKVSSYILTWGPSNRLYTSFVQVNKDRLSAHTPDLPLGLWHFACLAVGTNGLSSDPSAELLVTNKVQAATNLVNRTLSKTWTIPPGAMLQKSYDMNKWMEHIRNLGSNDAKVRVTDDGFGRAQFFRLFTNVVVAPPLPGGGGK